MIRNTMAAWIISMCGFVVGSPDAMAQCTCDATVHADVATPPPYEVGQSLTVFIELGAAGIAGGSSMSIPGVSYALDCFGGGYAETCVDEGSTMAYLGDATLLTDCGVDVSSNLPDGGADPNTIEFTFSPALDLPADAFCVVAFDVQILTEPAADPTPGRIEQAAGFAGVCDNGLQASAAIQVALDVEEGGHDCCSAAIASSVMTAPAVGTGYAVGNVIEVNLELAAETIHGGTVLHVDEVAYALDCFGGGDIANCVDAGLIVQYRGDGTLSSDCGVDMASSMPAGGSDSNIVTLTFAGPGLDLPAQSSCNIGFEIEILNAPAADSTPTIIEQAVGVEGSCDNGLAAVAGTRECLEILACGDADRDGCRDDACLWYAEPGAACIASQRMMQADVGGAHGDCALDGACDGHDRFHALNCFSNTDTQGLAGYPCEPHAPLAMNVDAGSHESCVLDGICDGNDAFHAANCFEDVWFDSSAGYLCLCAGPAPVQTARQDRDDRPVTQLRLQAPGAARAGQLIHVDVFAEGKLEALRGYQLHAVAAGSGARAPELLDVFVDTERRDWVFAGVPGIWSAFNQAAGQMVVGMDAQGGVPTRGGAYLATYAFRVPQGPAGRMTVGLRYSERGADHAERTFLFGRSARAIDISAIEPAVIKVRGPSLASKRDR